MTVSTLPSGMELRATDSTKLLSKQREMLQGQAFSTSLGNSQNFYQLTSVRMKITGSCAYICFDLFTIIIFS